MAKYRNYHSEIKAKVKHTKQALKDYKKQCEGSSIKDSDFYEKLEKLNQLRIDHKTAKSRLQHFNNKKTSRDEVLLPKTK